MLITRTMLVNSPLAPAPKLARARPEPRPDPEVALPIVVQSFVTQSFPPEPRPSSRVRAYRNPPTWSLARASHELAKLARDSLFRNSPEPHPSLAPIVARTSPETPEARPRLARASPEPRLTSPEARPILARSSPPIVANLARGSHGARPSLARASPPIVARTSPGVFARASPEARPSSRNSPETRSPSLARASHDPRPRRRPALPKLARGSPELAYGGRADSQVAKMRGCPRRAFRRERALELSWFGPSIGDTAQRGTITL